MVKILRANSEDIHIGENTTFEGNFETAGTIFIDGQLTKARIQASQLSIGPRGQLEGEVTVTRAEIGGVFTGQMTVSSDLVLRSTAQVKGEIACAQFVAHRGAAISAQITSRASQGAEAAPGPAASNSAAAFHRRRDWGRGASLGGAFVLGAVAAMGTAGTFLLFRLASMVTP